MSIELKTDPADLNNDTWKVSNAIHDCLAAHAMQMAIEEAAQLSNLSGPESPINQHRPMELCHWINERAAANLARLMGEGSQTSRKCPMDGTCCSHSDCATKCQEHST